MITKLAKDLVSGDIFIDPERAGRRPALVTETPSVERSEYLGETRAYVTLDDWTRWSAWSASYNPGQELEIVTEKEAIDQTVRNQIEHKQSMDPRARQMHMERFETSKAVI
jgi:hypothetical protein